MYLASLTLYMSETNRGNLILGYSWFVAILILISCHPIKAEIIFRPAEYPADFHQETVQFKGKIVSLDSGEPIHAASVKIKLLNLGTTSNQEGDFEVKIPSRPLEIEFSALGYKPFILQWTPEQVNVLIRLQSNPEALEAILIRSKKYSNRNNPAVELMEKVIANRKHNHALEKPNWRYERYEKKMMAASDVSDGIEKAIVPKRFRYFFDNQDSTLSPGRLLLPIYLEENLAQEYRRKQSPGKKTYIEKTLKTELDPRYINNENIQSSIQYIFKDIDLYENNILIYNRPFLSPVGQGAPLFYKYYIKDTLIENSIPYVRLDFEPRNDEDRLFKGEIWISLDGQYAVRKATLTIGGATNLNWINDMVLNLEFEPNEQGEFFPVLQDMRTNFGVFGSHKGMFGHWIQHYSKHSTSPIPPSVFGGQPIEHLGGSEVNVEDFNQFRRPVELRYTEAGTYVTIQRLNDDPSFSRLLSWASVFFTSYKKVGPFDIGKLEYTYSFNDVEGNRFRLGGRTNIDFSKKVYAEGYLAYGTKDERWKHYGSLAVSLNSNDIAAYPAHYLQFTYQNDIREPGQRLDFLNGDSFFRSFRSNKQNFWQYHRNFTLNHVIEFGNHVRLQTSVAKKEQLAAGDLKYINASTGQKVPNLNTFEVGLNLRWAPGEEFYQKNLVRSPIVNHHPIFTLRYNKGFKNVLGGQYDYQAVRGDISKKVLLSQLGYATITTGGGYIFGQVPFPLLEIPMSNRSYLLVEDSYSLMNDLEFVSDRYIKFNIEHQMEGFILNKIPLVKKLKLREYWSFRMFYGDVRAENDPFQKSPVFRFPETREGETVTFAMKDRPYMETSFGLENIFNVLRVEYVRRLSYLEHPDVKKNGFRFSVVLGF